MNRPAQILAAMFQGGGNIPLLMPVMTALVARGHHLRILAGPGVRPSRLPISESFTRRMAASGAEVVPFGEPDRHPYDCLQPPRGLIGGWVFNAMGSTGVTGFNVWSLFVAIIGAVILLVLYHALIRRPNV